MHLRPDRSRVRDGSLLGNAFAHKSNDPVLNPTACLYLETDFSALLPSDNMLRLVGRIKSGANSYRKWIKYNRETISAFKNPWLF